MIITLPWLKEHLKTKANENEIINKLTIIYRKNKSIIFLKDPIFFVIPFSLLGIMQGISNSLSGTFWPEYFGTKYLGDVRAIATSFMVIASALGPFLSGLMLDNQINLNVQFMMMSFVMSLSAIGLIYLSIKTKKILNTNL